jgi:hypothetical protein
VAKLYPQALGTHFSRLLRHAWVTVGLFFNPSHHTGDFRLIKFSRASTETSVSLRTRTEMVLEMSVLSIFNQLTRLEARENFINFSRRENFKS